MAKTSIKIKPILHEQENVGLVTSAIISNVQWGEEHRPPLAKHFGRQQTIKRTPMSIVNSVLKRPKNEGVVLGGLNWMNDIHGLCSILKEVAFTNLDILIAIPDSIDNFEIALGKYFVDQNDMEELTGIMAFDDSAFKVIGRNGLDALIGRRYNILIGMFDDVKLYQVEVPADIKDVNNEKIAN